MVNDPMVNLIGLLIPLLGTMLGSAFVFFMKQDMPVRLQKALLGFASGVMVAASVWSLLIPAIEAEAAKGLWAVMPAAVGFLLGILFLLAIDELTLQERCSTWWSKNSSPKPRRAPIPTSPPSVSLSASC